MVWLVWNSFGHFGWLQSFGQFAWRIIPDSKWFINVHNHG